ncbi:MAG TPA: hypothetical protein VEI97_14265, partial [bacterium]|nr:hypothetical protein [bacterium]
MAAELTIFDDGSASLNRHIRFVNVNGTPLVAALLGPPGAVGGGRALADLYGLSLVHAGGNWQITVTPEHGEPYSVALPDPLGTVPDAILQGVVLTFATLNPLLTYSAEVHVGYHAGTVVAGAFSATKQLWVKNTGDADGLDARIQVRPDATFENVTGSPINAIQEDLLPLSARVGTFTLTRVGSGAPVEFEVSFEGEILGTYEVQGNDPSLYLDLPRGPRVIFDLLSTLDEGDEAMVTVNPGFQRVLLAPDVAGSPGTFSNADVVL